MSIYFLCPQRITISVLLKCIVSLSDATLSIGNVDVSQRFSLSEIHFLGLIHYYSPITTLALSSTLQSAFCNRLLVPLQSLLSVNRISGHKQILAPDASLCRISLVISSSSLYIEACRTVWQVNLYGFHVSVILTSTY